METWAGEIDSPTGSASLDQAEDWLISGTVVGRCPTSCPSMCTIRHRLSRCNGVESTTPTHLPHLSSSPDIESTTSSDQRGVMCVLGAEAKGSRYVLLRKSNERGFASCTILPLRRTRTLSKSIRVENRCEMTTRVSAGREL